MFILFIALCSFSCTISTAAVTFSTQIDPVKKGVMFPTLHMKKELHDFSFFVGTVNLESESESDYLKLKIPSLTAAYSGNYGNLIGHCSIEFSSYSYSFYNGIQQGFVVFGAPNFLLGYSHELSESITGSMFCGFNLDALCMFDRSDMSVSVSPNYKNMKNSFILGTQLNATLPSIYSLDNKLIFISRYIFHNQYDSRIFGRFNLPNDKSYLNTDVTVSPGSEIETSLCFAQSYSHFELKNSIKFMLIESEEIALLSRDAWKDDRYIFSKEDMTEPLRDWEDKSVFHISTKASSLPSVLLAEYRSELTWKASSTLSLSVFGEALSSENRLYSSLGLFVSASW